MGNKTFYRIYIESMYLSIYSISLLFINLNTLGEGLTYLLNERMKIAHSVLPHVRVFARVNPKQKEAVITTLKVIITLTTKLLEIFLKDFLLYETYKKR